MNDLILLIERLNQKKVSQLTHKENPLAQAEAYSQSLLYRVVELTQGTIDTYLKKQFLSSLSIAKSLIETVITFVCFYEELSCVENIEDTKDLDKIFVNYCLSRGSANKELEKIAAEEIRIPDVDPNITAAKTIKKRLEKWKARASDEAIEVENLYTGLCEHAHPNSLGTYTFFVYSVLKHDDINIGVLPEAEEDTKKMIAKLWGTVLPIFEKYLQENDMQIHKIKGMLASK